MKWTSLKRKKRKKKEKFVKINWFDWLINYIPSPVKKLQPILKVRF